MRCLLPAICLTLASLAGSFAATSSAPHAAASSAAPAAPAPSPPPSGAANPDSDAAAKHRKRTACLDQARAKKLVGAQKTAYIKDCVGAS